MLKVAFFEFSVYPGVFPLIGGCLEAATNADPILRERFVFQKQCIPVADTNIPAQVEESEADIYAFSCYVWNMGLIGKLIQGLRLRKPDAYIVLGGPQVMHRAAKYLSPARDREFICNGEGERTFPQLLRQIDREIPDFHLVRGVSFYDNGELITTEPEERIRDLNEIPSPYLSGLMDPKRAAWGVLETNRGCPFRCSYCYWGGATNAKVTKYSADRIMDEITWFGENRVHYVFIADANFGMLQRDLDIANHIAAVRKRTGYPVSVYFSSSKNTPEKVAKVATVLSEAGLVSTLPISLQTVNEDTLRHIQRENIRPESYLKLQSVLNERNVSSFIELIWPLPGETLKSFVAGLNSLCTMGADSFSVYPLLLIGNVEMEKQQEEFGLVSISDPDSSSEARIVIATRDVTNAEYLEGVRIAFHLTSVYSVRGLWHVGKYLNDEKLISYSSLLNCFTDFCRSFEGHPYYEYVESSIASSAYYKFTALGALAHNVLHQYRSAFDELLVAFVQAMGWLNDDEVALRLDLDLLNRPYIYSNTRVPESKGLRVLTVQSSENAKKLIHVPSEWRSKVAKLLNLKMAASGCLSVTYRTSAQLPHMTGKSAEANYAYCQDRLHTMRKLLPKWASGDMRFIPMDDTQALSLPMQG